MTEPDSLTEHNAAIEDALDGLADAALTEPDSLTEHNAAQSSRPSTRSPDAALAG